MLPKLFFRFPASPGWVIAFAGFLLLAIGFALAARRGEAGATLTAYSPDAGRLIALVALSCIIIFSFSAAGSIRGWTVRYIAPLWTVMPIFCGIGALGLWRRNAAVASVAVAMFLLPNLLAYGLPGSALRSELAVQLRDDAALRSTLARDGVGLVYGDYLWVYHINFDSQESIAGVPSDIAYDYYHYGEHLRTRSVRWALIGSLGQISDWRRATRSGGTLLRSGDLWVFIAAAPASAADLLLSLRKS